MRYKVLILELAYRNKSPDTRHLLDEVKREILVMRHYHGEIWGRKLMRRVRYIEARLRNDSL